MSKFLIFFGIVFCILPTMIDWANLLPTRKAIILTLGCTSVLVGYLTMPNNLVKKYLKHLEEEKFLKEKEEFLKEKSRNN